MDYLSDVLLTEAQLQAAREKQIIKVWWTGCFWCGHEKKLLGLEVFVFFFRFGGFIYDKVFSFLFLLGFFLMTGVFFSLGHKRRLFFLRKDWRIGWLVGGWEFEVGIPGELQLIIPLLKKTFLFSPLGKWLKWSNLTIIFFSWVVQVKIVRVRCPLTATNLRDRFFLFFLQEIMTNEAWGHGFRWGFTENALKTCIKIVIVLEILELEFCIQNASWFGATSREAFRYTVYDFLVKMGWST